MFRFVLQHLASINDTRALLQGLGGLLGVSLVVFFYKLYCHRSMIRRIRDERGVMMMPHSWLFGHIPAIVKAMKNQKVPADLDTIWSSRPFFDEYPDVAATGALYVDLWPMTLSLLAVTNPDMTTQMTVSPSLPKHSYFRDSHIASLTGGIDMVSTDIHWKSLRGTYSQGFSAKNISNMTPWFVQEAKVFRKRLLEAAKSGETIELETWSLDLTLDTVARMIFGVRSRIQESYCPTWLPAFRTVTALMTFENDMWKTWYPPSIYRRWRDNRVMRAEFSAIIDQVYRDYAQNSPGPNTLVELAVKPYAEAGQPVPPEVMNSIVQNIKILLAAGFETAGCTLARVLYLLSKNPDKLAKLRAEHDEVFGTDPEAVPDAILADHTILNQLPYTIAAVKETLRLIPPTNGSVREAPLGFELVNPQSGQRFPAGGFLLNNAAGPIGWSERFWPDASAFIPERFLVRDERDPLYPVKHAWQPFSLGPRACIGQEMAQIEIRIAVALVVRDLDFAAQYAPDAPSVQGECAYGVRSPETTIIARTKDALPVKVKRRGHVGFT